MTMNPKNGIRVAGSWLPALAPLTLVAVLACGTTPPPKELVDARSSYDRAKDGTARELAQAELDTAKQALRKAEAMFDDSPDDTRVRDLAYIADRKAQLAEAVAVMKQAEADKQEAEKKFKEYSESELGKVRGALGKSQSELEAEKKAREEAEKAKRELEKQLQNALASLKEIAAIKEEARGVVITMQGSVLFASGKSELLPIAKERLSQVGKSLKDQGSPKLRVEGHTDSIGSAEENRKLSLARAESVKSHLASDGYPAAKISTAGHGPDRPVADNGNAEGRANNRRVEIVVNPTDGK
jgi:outer membrane protein OmpA-like peptidoglycan-associated protein